MTDVHIVWVSFHEGIAHAGYWDEGIIEAAFDGTLWRPAGLPNFVHHFEFDELPPGAGAVVVVPARWHTTDLVRLNTEVTPLPWCLLILAGDEQSSFPWGEVIHSNMRVWVQTPRPGLHDGADRLLGDGWPPNCRPLLAPLEDLAAHRELAWSFAGQINNADREACHTALVARQQERGDGEVHATRIFGSGMPYPDYLRLLATTKVVPCPSGCFSVDTFRLFEALEAGCVPVAAAVAPTEPVDGYWPFLFGEDPPFPIIEDWNRFGEVCDTIVADWPASSNRVFAWWQAVKRRIAHDLMADLAALGAVGEPEFDPCHHITVLVPTSPIPSHPDTAIIEAAIASIRERLPTAEIIVMVDGVRDEQANRRADYAEYTRRLLWKANHEWVNVLPVVFDEHLHQAAMTRRCLSMVHTETILFVEHDTPLCGEQVPWALFLGAIGSGDVNIIRLHHEAEIHPSHRHLMLGTEPQWVAGVPLLRTVQYSQRPHLASTAFYRKMIATYFGAEARTMIEDVVYGALSVAWNEFAERGWRDFRLWMYAPDGDMKRSTHTDGRGEDPKFAMRFAYDGDTPLGAPRPTRDPEPAVVVTRSDVRLGVFGARADRRGLAIQSTEVCRHLNPVAVFGIDMGELSPYPNDWSDYDPATLTVVTNERVNREMVRDWLTANDIDVVWSAETFYFDWFTGLAAECGVRTVLAPNPEFFSHVASWPPLPDVLAAPTRWRIGDMPGAILLPHPVDRERLPFRQRTEASTFLMVVGHLATRDRQGTRILWEALNHVTQPVRVIIRSQRDLCPPHAYGSHIELDIRCGDVADYWDLYSEGDVFIHPRRYGGNDLPLLEALSCFPAGTPIEAAGIQRSMVRPYTGLLYRIETIHGYVEATAEHPFWTERGWLPASELRMGLRLLYGSHPSSPAQTDIYSGGIENASRALSLHDTSRSGRADGSHLWLGGMGEEETRAKQNCPRTVDFARMHFDAGSVGLLGGHPRWGGDGVRPQVGEFTNKMDSAFRGIEYESRPDRLASQYVARSRHLRGISQECATSQRGLGIQAERAELFAALRSRPPVLDRQASTNGMHHRILPGEIGPRSLRSHDGNTETASGTHSHSEYTRITGISTRAVTGLPVFNVTTASSTFFANGMLVHNCGMPVLATDASPQRGFLPPEMLLPCSSDRVFRSLVGDLALHDVNPWGLATRIDALASDPAEVARLSLLADEVAQRFSWEAQRPEWEAVFARVVAGERLTA